MPLPTIRRRRSLAHPTGSWAGTVGDVDPLELMLRCLDLTSLADADADERIQTLCTRAIEPAPGAPHVAAVCVAPRFAALVRRSVEGSGVRLAIATGAFPTGVLSTDGRAAEIRAAVDAGADEIDTVLDHAALVLGRDEDARQQLIASREACAGRTMKVILETGALP